MPTWSTFDTLHLQLKYAALPTYITHTTDVDDEGILLAFKEFEKLCVKIKLFSGSKEKTLGPFESQAILLGAKNYEIRIERKY